MTPTARTAKLEKLAKQLRRESQDIENSLPVIAERGDLDDLLEAEVSLIARERALEHLESSLTLEDVIV